MSHRLSIRCMTHMERACIRCRSPRHRCSEQGRSQGTHQIGNLENIKQLI